MDLLLEAITLYAGPMESDISEIKYMETELNSMLSGASFTIDNMVITSDPGEDTDDILMIKYILTNITNKVHVIISGGALTPEERFQHLKRIFPEFQNAHFGVQFGNIVFLPDGEKFTEPVKCYVNCGPCHSVTLRSIFDQLNISKGCMVTVGANSNGTAAGINQKQTDEGVLKDLKWNEYLATLSDVTIKNLEVGVSRYVLLPHPSLIIGPYASMPEECFTEMIYTLAMFYASRPPAKFALRTNQGNSIVISQLINIMSYVSVKPEQFEYGLQLIKKYEATCPTREIAVSAAIPLMATALMGGVYKEGVFGFDPKDKTAKQTVACLTPESVPLFLSNIQKSHKFTPGYDLLAITLAKQLKK